MCSCYCYVPVRRGERDIRRKEKTWEGIRLEVVGPQCIAVSRPRDACRALKPEDARDGSPG